MLAGKLVYRSQVQQLGGSVGSPTQRGSTSPSKARMIATGAGGGGGAASQAKQAAYTYGASGAQYATRFGSSTSLSSPEVKAGSTSPIPSRLGSVGLGLSSVPSNFIKEGYIGSPVLKAIVSSAKKSGAEIDGLPLRMDMAGLIELILVTVDIEYLFTLLLVADLQQCGCLYIAGFQLGVHASIMLGFS